MNAAIGAMFELQREQSQLKNRFFTAVGGKDEASAMADIELYNKRWPDAPITSKMLRDYVKYRKREAGKTDIQKIGGKRFEQLVPEEQRR